MNWEEILMDGIVPALIGAIAAIGVSIINDRKGYNRIDAKVGKLDNKTLSGQHNQLFSLIKEIKEDIKKTILDRADYTDRTSRELYSKVDNIDRIMNKNEVRYETLNLDQKEVRNNVNKLVNSWETLIKENQELKEKNKKLEKENMILNSKIAKYEDTWEREL